MWSPEIGYDLYQNEALKNDLCASTTGILELVVLVGKCDSNKYKIRNIDVASTI